MHHMFKKREENMSIIWQDMEHIHGMSGDEKYSFWDENYTGWVLMRLVTIICHRRND